MHHFFRELNSKEHRLFARNNTPQKIQTYLDSLSVNFEIEENTLQSPRRVMTSGKAQCFEGALLGAAMLWYHGYTPMVLDLVTIPGDDSHVVAVFKEGKKWGALSKTNHAVLRYRDAVYASPRELAMSYFHEYFLDSGEKTLESYAVFPLGTISKNWIIDSDDLWYIDHALDMQNHEMILPSKKRSTLRKAHKIERLVGKLVIEKKPN